MHHDKSFVLQTYNLFCKMCQLTCSRNLDTVHETDCWTTSERLLNHEVRTFYSRVSRENTSKLMQPK